MISPKSQERFEKLEALLKMFTDKYYLIVIRGWGVTTYLIRPSERYRLMSAHRIDHFERVVNSFIAELHQNA